MVAKPHIPRQIPVGFALCRPGGSHLQPARFEMGAARQARERLFRFNLNPGIFVK
jgi:hypothetical protein